MRCSRGADMNDYEKWCAKYPEAAAAMPAKESAVEELAEMGVLILNSFFMATGFIFFVIVAVLTAVTLS